MTEADFSESEADEEKYIEKEIEALKQEVDNLKQ